MILVSQIDLGIRARSSLTNIPALAEDISEKGLISPILLTKKTLELVADYEAFHQINLDSNRSLLLTCGGRRMAALQQLDIHVLYPGTSCDPKHPGCIIREDTGLLDLLLIEGRENRNRLDLDWRDDMKLIVSAYRLARQQANEEGEYLVMKDFACLLGVSHTTLGIAEQVYDDYLSDPESYREATSVYQALSISLKKVANVATKVLLHRQLNARPIIHEVEPKGGDIHAVAMSKSTVKEPGPVEVQSSTGPEPITIPLSKAFFTTDYIQFLRQQPEGFCDHIVTDTRSSGNIPLLFLDLAFKALPQTGYLALWVPAFIYGIWENDLQGAGFEVQSHPLIWNKIDFRSQRSSLDRESFAQSYETCLLARKPGSILAQAQNSSIYTSSHIAKEETFGQGYIPPEVFSWIIRAIAVPGQVIYDPFARTGASAIGTLHVKCRPIGTESDKGKYGTLIKNLKDYYTKQLPSVQFT